MPAQRKHFNVRLLRLRWWVLIGPPALVVGVGLLMLLSEFPPGRLVRSGATVQAVWLSFDSDIATAHEPGYSSSSPLRTHPDVHGVFITGRHESSGWPVTFSETTRLQARMEPLFGSERRELNDELTDLVVRFRSHEMNEAHRNSLLTGHPEQKRWSVWRFALNALIWVCFIIGPIGTLLCLPVAAVDCWRARLNRRYRRRLCPSCKYSLQGLGSLPSQCPECGCTWEPPIAQKGPSDSPGP